jgi:hypothetical protein
MNMPPAVLIPAFGARQRERAGWSVEDEEPLT